MINIAICDDDVAFTTVVEELLYSCGQTQGIKVTCEIYFDGAALVEAIRQGGSYDLIYLDIEMQQMSGIHAAEWIREREVSALIVYVSGYEKYLKELFETEPFRFLSKPIDREAFRAVFMAACKRLCHNADSFSFTYKKAIYKLPLRTISYFESRNRLVLIHMAGREKDACTENTLPKERFYGKINEVEKQISQGNSRFIRIHQSFLVNFDHIKSMSYTTVTLFDGTLLPISEDRQKRVRAGFCSMLGEEAHTDA